MALPAWLESAQTTAKSLRKFSAFTGTKYLEPGLKPPTNSWISGVAFGENPIWTLTGLTVKPTKTGLNLHLVRPTVWGDKALIGAYTDEYAVTVKLGDASGRVVSYYDDAAAQIRYRNAANQIVANVDVAQGWPYVLITGSAATVTAVTISRAGATITPFARTGVNAYLLTEADGTSYVIVTPRTSQVSGSTLTTQVSQEDIYIAGLPKNSSSATTNAFIDGMRPVEVARTTYTVDKAAKKTRTVIEYYSSLNTPTLLGYLPHQKPVDTSLTPVATFTTILGVVTLYRTSKVDFESKLYDTTAYALDLSPLTAGEKETLKGLVRSDATKLDFPGDTYFGGKALFRATNLLVLANQLGLTAEAATLTTRLKAELDLWFNPQRTNTHSDKTFVFDDNLLGVVGLVAGFGSDETFNDHHFHYGYLLYAAGVLATLDPTLVAKYRPIADVLVADIAAPVATDTTIARRSFDDYAGHSWANGTGGGVDGNDQESTAEAINAWSGVSLWAKASGNTAVLDQALWMASLEAQTAKQYWFNPFTLPGFAKPHVSMLFAGKSDYATWFSADRSDVTGIQVIPLSAPVAEHLRDLGPARIKELFNSILVENPAISGRSHLIDWNIMFLSLADKAAALAHYKTLKDSDIDNGNTRSHMFATILGGPGVTPDIPDEPNEPEEPNPVGKHYKNGDSIPAHFSIGTNGVARTIVFRVASGAADGISGLVSVEINGQKVATIAVANTGGWDKFVDLRGNFPDLHGEFDGFVRFESGQPNEYAAIDSLTIEGVDSTVTLGDVPPPPPEDPDEPEEPEEPQPQPLKVVLQFNPDGSVTWIPA